MGSITNYLETKWADHVFRGTSYTSPAAVYAALFEDAPTEASGGTEVTGNNYSRVAITFGAPSGNVIANSTKVTFPTPTPGGWGSNVRYAIFDAASGGNMLAFQDTGQGAVNAGDTVEFDIGDLTAIADRGSIGGWSTYAAPALLNHTFRNTAMTAPSAWYMAISQANMSTGGTGFSEMTGGGYSRKAVTIDGTTGQTLLDGDTWWRATDGTWGTVWGFALFDAISGGNMLAWCDASGGTVTPANGEYVFIPDNANLWRVSNDAA